MADLHYVLRCFYPEVAPKMHQLPYCVREIFMALTMTIATMDRGRRI